MPFFFRSKQLQQPKHCHVEEQLLDLVTHGWHPTPAEMEHVVTHLSLCNHCQIVLAALVVHLDDTTQEGQEVISHTFKVLSGIIARSSGAEQNAS